MIATRIVDINPHLDKEDALVMAKEYEVYTRKGFSMNRLSHIGLIMLICLVIVVSLSVFTSPLIPDNFHKIYEYTLMAIMVILLQFSIKRLEAKSLHDFVERQIKQCS